MGTGVCCLANYPPSSWRWGHFALALEIWTFCYYWKYFPSYVYNRQYTVWCRCPMRSLKVTMVLPTHTLMPIKLSVLLSFICKNISVFKKLVGCENIAKQSAVPVVIYICNNASQAHLDPRGILRKENGLNLQPSGCRFWYMWVLWLTMFEPFCDNPLTFSLVYVWLLVHKDKEL